MKSKMDALIAGGSGQTEAARLVLKEPPFSDYRGSDTPDELGKAAMSLARDYRRPRKKPPNKPAASQATQKMPTDR